MPADPDSIEEVRRLVQEAVPEVAAGTVELVRIARAKGVRTVLVVRSHDPAVDPVGACVGRRGQAIKAVKAAIVDLVDVVRWSETTQVLLSNLISPCRIEWLDMDEEARRADVYIKQDEVSLGVASDPIRARLFSDILGLRVTISEYF